MIPGGRNQPSEYERLRRKAAAGLELPLSTRKRVRRAVIGWTSASRFAAPSSYLQHRRSLSVSTMERKVLKGVSVSRPMTLSPIPHVQKQHIGGDGMPLADICEAALTLSDNTAGNLMLKSVGGPAGLTQFARSIGDTVPRLDRMETALKEALPGDVRDTTSPRAMAHDIQNLVLGRILSHASKATLIGWLRANKTSDRRFRAAVPKDWIVGDKTGSGDRGSTNDVGIVWPPTRKPLIVAVYLTNTAASPDHCNETVAKVMRTVVAAAGG